jgi:hypothetical protein
MDQEGPFIYNESRLELLDDGEMLIQDQGGEDDSYFYENKFGILNNDKICSTTSKNTNLASATNKSVRDFEEILKTERKIDLYSPKISEISDLTDIKIKFSVIPSPNMIPIVESKADSITILARNPYW